MEQKNFKKQYETPTMKVVQMKFQGILCNSIGDEGEASPVFDFDDDELIALELCAVSH